MLTRDMILAAHDVKTERVEVPEWGGFVYVRTFDGISRDTIERHLMRDGEGQANTVGLRALVVTLAACNDKGAPIFTQFDVAELQKKSGAALMRVFLAAQKLNGMGAEGEARENFSAAQSVGSGLN